MCLRCKHNERINTEIETLQKLTKEVLDSTDRINAVSYPALQELIEQLLSHYTSDVIASLAANAHEPERFGDSNDFAAMQQNILRWYFYHIYWWGYHVKATNMELLSLSAGDIIEDELHGEF